MKDAIMDTAWCIYCEAADRIEGFAKWADESQEYLGVLALLNMIIGGWMFHLVMQALV